MKHFKIERLSYIQRAAMITISHFFEHGFNKMSLKFETGAGKTTLALLLILQTGLKK
jgi:superfamily II DNA or RNA helicase